MPSVKIYTTTTCPFCRQTKSFLEAHHVAFEEIDVAVNEAEAEVMIKKSGQMGVPVTVVIDEQKKEHVIVGFDQKALSKALGI